MIKYKKKSIIIKNKFYKAEKQYQEALRIEPRNDIALEEVIIIFYEKIFNFFLKLNIVKKAEKEIVLGENELKKKNFHKY